MTDTKADITINELHGVTMNVHVSKILTFRMKIMMILMRLAAWVGSVDFEATYED